MRSSDLIYENNEPHIVSDPWYIFYLIQKYLQVWLLCSGYMLLVF